MALDAFIISVCEKCGLKDAKVVEALALLQERFAGVELDRQNCLMSCNLPAVLVGDRQFILRKESASDFAGRIAAHREAPR